jgi:protein-tyrosine phosphatase
VADNPFRLVFVCSGNTCRSPMAELVLAEQVRRAGLAGLLRVSSAGTDSAQVGESIAGFAAELLTERGYPAEHVAVQVGEPQLAADLLVPMAANHDRWLRERVAEPGRVRLFCSFDPTAGDVLDVPDPYGGDRAAYQHVLDLVLATTPRLLAWVRGRLAA